MKNLQDLQWLAKSIDHDYDAVKYLQLLFDPEQARVLKSCMKHALKTAKDIVQTSRTSILDAGV